MSVAATVTLPAQPAAGGTAFIPLGGNGQAAPLGCYQADVSVTGDAGGGTATLTMTLDTRYTNLIAFVNATVSSAAAAPDFALKVDGGIGTTPASVIVVGTMPHQGVDTINAAFLWYPPPVYYIQGGRIRYVTDNVDATEAYRLNCQIYCFHPEATRLTPLPFLQWNVPGVSAPAAI